MRPKTSDHTRSDTHAFPLAADGPSEKRTLGSFLDGMGVVPSCENDSSIARLSHVYCRLHYSPGLPTTKNARTGTSAREPDFKPSNLRRVPTSTYRCHALKQVLHVKVCIDHGLRHCCSCDIDWRNGEIDYQVGVSEAGLRSLSSLPDPRMPIILAFIDRCRAIFIEGQDVRSQSDPAPKSVLSSAHPVIRLINILRLLALAKSKSSYHQARVIAMCLVRALDRTDDYR
jgi:hypothetical protein